MAVIRVARRVKLAAAVLLAMLGTAMISQAVQADSTPLPRELVQYVREAKKRGEEEAKIRRQAVTAGWSAVEVDQAIANEKGDKDKGDKGGKIAELAPGANKTAPEPPRMAPAPPPQPTAPDSVADAPDRILAPGGNPAPAVVPRGVSDDYLIGSGDTLQVSVWKEPELSVPSAVVRPDGRITVPLMKEVEVAGLTQRQAEDLIAAGLGKFITDPNVTVVIAAITSKKIYVIGAVRREGTLPYTYGMTVMQALSEAGGLNDYAKRKKIYILRTESGREYRLDFNYDEVVKGERMEQNIVLLPNDTLVIPH